MKQMVRRVVCLWPFIIWTFSSLQAQETGFPYQTPEEGFDLMREYASAGRYDAAEEVGYRLLEENPDYDDVSLYLARIYGWQGKYDSAYATVEAVLARDSTLLEAYLTRIDIAYWENDWLRLAEYAEEALKISPGETGIRERYILARYMLAGGQEVPEVYGSYLYDHFRMPYVRNWHMLTAGGKIPFRAGTLIPYVSAGYHAGHAPPSTDIQLNLDSYIFPGKRNYVLAGYGISPGSRTMFLPLHRAVLEAWQVLPAGFALSAGLRYFYWEQHFTFLTFSGEKYAGNYWFSLRNYLFLKDYGVSGSYYLTARRYLADRYDYLSATLGFGTAPDEPVLVATDLERLGAVSFRAGISKRIRYNLRVEASAGYAREEYADREYRHRIHINTGLYIRLVK
jgi:YaiO family outer membrane protein